MVAVRIGHGCRGELVGCTGELWMEVQKFWMVGCRSEHWRGVQSLAGVAEVSCGQWDVEVSCGWGVQRWAIDGRVRGEL